MRIEASRILRNVHESARQLHAAGHMDDVTMLEFDALCLPPPPKFTAKDVRRIRKKDRSSQGDFSK
jgi:putative transcriptional regulator